MLSVSVPCQLFSSSTTDLGLLALLEESLLAGLLVLLVLDEVTVGADLVDDARVDAAQVNLGGGGDDIAGVDSPERDAVDLEGTGDEENTLGQVLEEDDALAAEAASEEDEDGTGLEGGTRLGGTDGLADLRKSGNVSFWCCCVVRISRTRSTAGSSGKARAVALAAINCNSAHTQPAFPPLSRSALIQMRVPCGAASRPQPGSTWRPSRRGEGWSSRPCRTSWS